MDIIDLRHLSATIQAGNFSRAARHLGLNPATVSRRIARLEDEIGVTLFERGPFGIRMTTAGDAIMVHVHRAVENLEAIVGLAGNGGVGRIGTVRLGVRMPPVGEPFRGLLSAWRDQHRTVGLSVHEMNDHEINAALAERRFQTYPSPGQRSLRSGWSLR
jgi:DNA-binding transcriptional LysR family regulator